MMVQWWLNGGSMLLQYTIYMIYPWWFNGGLAIYKSIINLSS